MKRWVCAVLVGSLCGGVWAEDGQVMVVAGVTTNVLETVWIGETGQSNGLVVVGGGVLKCPDLVIGIATTANHNYGLVEGPGSAIQIDRGLTVGAAGSSNRLVVTGGARVAASAIRVGARTSAQANAVRLSGADSLITADWLVVGNWGGGSILEAASGARLVTGTSVVGEDGSNNIIRLSGEGTFWRCTDSIRLGGYRPGNRLEVLWGAGIECDKQVMTSPQGQLLVGWGGVLTSRSAVVVAGLSADEPSALIVGSGSAWLCRSNLTLNGVYRADDSPGLAVRSGGHLVATNGLGTSTLDLWRGVIEVKDASITADRIFGGAKILVSNGRIQSLRGFTVGGQLSGTGEITGAVTNRGTIEAGTGPGGLRVVGSLETVGQVHVRLAAATNPSEPRLHVAGEARLDGQLFVGLEEGLRPGWTDQFAALGWNNRSGSFSNAPPGARLQVGIPAPGIVLPPNRGSFRVHYQNDRLVLTDYWHDADRDGIDDLWAQTWFGHSPLSLEERLSDTDGDGMSNAAEAVAGTDPTDPASVFKLVSITPSTEGWRVRFTQLPGKWYRVWRGLDLETWVEIAAPQFEYPAPGIAEWTDASPAGSGAVFYRVSVE
jgi:hypothetical protein